MIRRPTNQSTLTKKGSSLIFFLPAYPKSFTATSLSSPHALLPPALSGECPARERKNEEGKEKRRRRRQGSVRSASRPGHLRLQRPGLRPRRACAPRAGRAAAPGRGSGLQRAAEGDFRRGPPGLRGNRPGRPIRGFPTPTRSPEGGGRGRLAEGTPPPPPLRLWAHAQLPPLRI